MAIQMRRGAYTNFNPAKLMPGEWAVVVSGDSNAEDGKAAYICFAAGDVKRVATYEDMVDNDHNAVDQNNGAIIKEITDAANKVNSSVIAAAKKSANEATNASNAAADAANRADAAAKSAAASTKPYFIQQNEPPRDKRVDGMLWMQTNESTHKITSFNRWDANAPGTALWPGATTYPSSSTYPDQIGAWTPFTA